MFAPAPMIPIRIFFSHAANIAIFRDTGHREYRESRTHQRILDQELIFLSDSLVCVQNSKKRSGPTPLPLNYYLYDLTLAASTEVLCFDPRPAGDLPWALLC